MIEVKDQNIVIDGKPTLIMAAEMHYFRLKPEEWQDRIDKIKSAGFNTISSYIPWLCHETGKGEFDFDGTTHPELNVKAFIDLCDKNGLYFFARPGPFIMAELKNEGLPYRLFEENPEIKHKSWNGKTATGPLVDFLDPVFLKESRLWLEAVVKDVLGPRIQPQGGNVIGIQLDNEIGMLQLVNNKPDMSDNMIADFSAWLQKRYTPESLQSRYPDVEFADVLDVRKKLRTPIGSYGPHLMRDLGHYMRNRFAQYVATLRAFCEESGVNDVPYFINIHGCSGSRGIRFPVGISQLSEAYTQAPGYVAGSDYYINDLTMDTFQDIYFCNAFIKASQRPEQPLTSLEFACGDGNYGNTYSNRLTTAAIDLKTRMTIAQDARMLNYYIISGGRNFRLDKKPNDGSNRIAITGERHGYAAPISPEGKLNYTYERMARITNMMTAVADKLVTMHEDHDNLTLAYIPDYFMTESHHPQSQEMKDIIHNLQGHRSGGVWEVMGRAALLNSYRFGALDIQNNPLDPRKNPVMMLPSARYMDGGVQKKIADWLKGGGNLLLYGEVPRFDMDGRPCDILSRALGATPKGFKTLEHDYILSIEPRDWATPKAETRAYFAQTFEENEKLTPLFRVHDTGEICAFETKTGKGHAIVLATTTPCDDEFMPFYKQALSRLGSRPKLRHDYHEHGIFMTSSSNKKGEKFIHIINLDDVEKKLHVYEDGKSVFGRRKIALQPQDGIMLPLRMTFNDVSIIKSTAEIASVSSRKIDFRLTQAQDEIFIKTDRKIRKSKDYDFQVEGGITRVTSLKNAKIDNHLTLRFF